MFKNKDSYLDGLELFPLFKQNSLLYYFFWTDLKRLEIFILKS